MDQTLLRILIQQISILYLLAVVMIVSCTKDESDAKRPDLDRIEIRPEVVFTTVDDKPLRYFIETRGVVEPIQRVKLINRIGGFVEKNHIRDGRKVAKEELLLQLNDEEWQLAVNEARNAFLKAKNQYDIDLRLRGTNGDGSKESRELIRINTGLADAEVAYERAKLNLSYTTLKAPFSGVLASEEVISPGSYLSAGTEMGILVNAQTVHIRFDILESEIIQLESGMNVELTDPSEESYMGSIIGVSPQIDPETKTGQILVEVKNQDGSLKPGMTVEGTVFVRSLESKVRAPRSALLERDGRTLVFKYHGGLQQVEWIYITPEAMNSDWILINHESINLGDTLAIDRHFSISHQQKVKLIID